MFSRCFVVVNFVSYVGGWPTFSQRGTHDRYHHIYKVTAMMVEPRRHGLLDGCNKRYSWQFYISTIGVTWMIDYDTTTTAVDNRLRRYRQINLCSDDRASIVSLNLLVAEPMSSKRTSWLRLFFACFECLSMYDVGYLPATIWLRRSSFAWKKHGKGQVYLSHQAFYMFPRRFSSAWCISTLLTFRAFFRGAT